MNKTLYRDEYHKKIGGVCAGLAEYFDMDVTIVRLLFVLTVIIMGVGVLPYVVLWIVLPKRPYPYRNFNDPTVDYTVPPQQPGEQFTTPPPANAYTNNPYGSNPFGGNPFTNDTVPPPVRQKSNAGIIVGAVLILLGAAILIDNYDLIPDFDFERLWPAILVIVGAALIVSGPSRKTQVNSWEKSAEPQDAGDNGIVAEDQKTE